MKITIDIDCTPQEARAFLGLPNVEPMQDALVEQLRERLARNLDAMDPDTLMKAWFPAGLEGFGKLQEHFWQQMMSGLATPSAQEDKPKSDKKGKK